ncbi:MAG: PAS domain S-box protein [Promethearchaeota archaeon]|nr:MAG: PAS domain S-box protein [Candidatus Lokiarchaeota archaeon]
MKGLIPKLMLEIIFESFPVSISVLDVNDKVIGWNHHKTGFFKRPESVLGKDVRNCHPKKSLDKEEKVLSEMKQGTRNKTRFWIDNQLDYEKQPKKILIEYYAIRDIDGNYVGCVEMTQDISDILRIEGEKHLLD